MVGEGVIVRVGVMVAVKVTSSSGKSSRMVGDTSSRFLITGRSAARIAEQAPNINENTTDRIALRMGTPLAYAIIVAFHLKEPYGTLILSSCNKRGGAVV